LFRSESRLSNMTKQQIDRRENTRTDVWTGRQMDRTTIMVSVCVSCLSIKLISSTHLTKNDQMIYSYTYVSSIGNLNLLIQLTVSINFIN